MNKTILVAGATGDLGGRIAHALIRRGAYVRAVVRPTADEAKVEALTAAGVQVMKVDMTSVDELAKACEGVDCVVSALAGLHDAIVEGQTVLLDAAVKAGVPRFIPSDYSSDFTQLPEGENRNFDLRKEFHKTLDAAPIAATSVMIGAFSDILAYGTPFYNTQEKSVAYWGDNPDWKVDFTTKDNTADYTAAAAIDDSTPKILRIAGFRLSPNELVQLGSEAEGEPFILKPMGSLEGLSAHNKQARAADPAGEDQLYPAWQGSQYMHSMFSVQNNPLDNGRHPDVAWTGAKEVISAM